MPLSSSLGIEAFGEFAPIREVEGMYSPEINLGAISQVIAVLALRPVRSNYLDAQARARHTICITRRMTSDIRNTGRLRKHRLMIHAAPVGGHMRDVLRR